MGLMTSMVAQRPEDVNDMEEDRMEGETPETEEPGESEVRVPPQIVAEVLRALSKPEVKKAIVEAGNSGNQVEALTGIAYGMIEALDEKAKGQIPVEQMPDIAMEIVDMLAELSGGGDDLKGQVLKALLEQSTQQAQRAVSSRQPGNQQPQQPQSQPQQQPMPQGGQKWPM